KAPARLGGPTTRQTSARGIRARSSSTAGARSPTPNTARAGRPRTRTRPTAAAGGTRARPRKTGGGEGAAARGAAGGAGGAPPAPRRIADDRQIRERGAKDHRDAGRGDHRGGDRDREHLRREARAGATAVGVEDQEVGEVRSGQEERGRVGHEDA